jgi:hypothetical protein
MCNRGLILEAFWNEVDNDVNGGILCSPVKVCPAFCSRIAGS